jgi:hypothetical protein
LAKPNSRFDFEQATQVTKQLVNQMPSWLRLSFIRSWVFWAIITLGISGGLVYLALGLLLNPKAVPNCPEIFVPMSSASLRVYCGQLAASKQTLKDLVSALNLVKDVAPNDPTRGYIDSNVQRWSLAILRLAEATYQEGNYDEAVNAAKKVPKNIPAYKIVSKRLGQWQETWTKGVALDKETRALLNSSKWVNAYGVAVKLTHLNNRYWATTKYQELADLVQIAKADSAKLDEARQLLKNNPTVKSLLTAVEMANKIDPKSFAHTEAQTIVSTAAKQMLKLARTKLDKRDWKGALEIANQTPDATETKTELQDLISFAEAQSHAESGSISELETSISLIQSIKANSSLYQRSQQAMGTWQLEIQDLATLQHARSLASTSTVVDLQAAITEVQRIPVSNPRGKEAASVAKEWRQQIETVQDTPYLRTAETLAASGTVQGVQQAIAQLNQIRPGRALYAQAQEKSKQWTAEIQRAQDAPILQQAEALAATGDLRGAISMAQRIGAGRAMSAQREERVNDWQAQLQAATNLAAAQKLADNGTPESLLGAIKAAARVPKSSSLRAQARLAMDNWGNQMLEVAQSTATSDLRRAIAIAKAIPENTSSYSAAQNLIQQWQQQLNPNPEASPNSDNGTNGVLGN